MADLVSVSERAFPILEELGDEDRLAQAWWLVHWARFRTGRVAESIDAAERALAHAERAGDRREQLRAFCGIAMFDAVGTPVDEALRRCDDLVARADGARLVEAFAHRVRGGLLSMTGRFEEGREFCRRPVELYVELGHPIFTIGVASELRRVERQAGQLDVAERELRSALARLRAIGDVGYTSWVAAPLARVVAERGNGLEALELARSCREEMQRDHAFGQIAARLAEAIALDREGRSADAEKIALEALALVEETDILDLHGGVLLVLADLDRSAAGSHIAQAIELYERKGDIVSVARARELAHAGS